MAGTSAVSCPICSASVPEKFINQHIDSGCSEKHVISSSASSEPASSSQGEPDTPSKQFASLFSGQKRKAVDEPSSSQRNQSASTSSPRTPSAHSRRPSNPISSSASMTLPPSKKPRANGVTANVTAVAPLAERMRPQTLDDYVGQESVVGKGSLLRGLIDSGSAGSLVLWGPPGSGKTSLARIIARMTGSVIKELSATSSGSADVRAIFEEAKSLLQLTGKRTVLFVDEIQRFNRAQQDIFLPYVEKGLIQLIAATTENPSFKVVGALLSRCRVLVLQALSDENLIQIQRDAIARLAPTPNQTDSANATPPSGLAPATEDVMKYITALSVGDARTALNLLELVVQAPESTTPEGVMETLKNTTMSRYDRTGDDRYDMISALHKSLRGSDGSAAMYWLARMLTAGEDPLYVARRLIVVASEDVGLADSHALPLATATYFACQTIGMPECRINLAHCVAYLAEAPKSIRSYEAYAKAEAAAKRDPTLPVPLQIRNAPTKLMTGLGYGEDYAYNPSYAHPVLNTYLPEELRGTKFLETESEYAEASSRLWDEEKLVKWENEVNEGKEWAGRKERR
ncbi:P-loop containing nucleoside triphosphate hydrolase protein [Clavulina sp. PMI_390]|nr:P-loop containing nucleoside triphosphate hydrolase protein [Clavulina sp. PMI_390]